MRTCDVVIHSSTLPEPFGRVVVEGMLSGNPVIATDAGGVREIIEDGITGLLVAPGDVDGLVAAVRHVLADPAFGARLGEAARASAIERFAVDRYASEVWAALSAEARPQLGPPKSA